MATAVLLLASLKNSRRVAFSFQLVSSVAGSAGSETVVAATVAYKASSLLQHTTLSVFLGC